MASTIAWLDTSAETQQRVRELIALFEEKGTLDELGIGQIRDVFSNALFPGTSRMKGNSRGGFAGQRIWAPLPRGSGGVGSVRRFR